MWKEKKTVYELVVPIAGNQIYEGTFLKQLGIKSTLPERRERIKAWQKIFTIPLSYHGF